jgi:glycine oxidase
MCLRAMKSLSGVHVAVAGAGAFGLASALALARTGATVTIYDPAPVGQSASGVAAGMLAPEAEALFDPVSSPHLDLLRRALALWPDFAAGLDIALIRDGLQIEGASPWLDSLRFRAATLGLGLADRPDGALGLDGDLRLEARPALAALERALQALGVRVEAQAVAGFVPGRLVLADGRIMAADHLVVATGAAGPAALPVPELAHLSPIRGQIARLVVGPADGPVLRGQGVYVCPGARPAVGATMEAGRADLVPDPEGIRPLLEAAGALRPGLRTSDARIEVGVRAATPDGLPLVGPGALAGVCLAVGARRNGWLLAPLVAGLVAAYLTGKDPGPDAARLDARRFDREPEAEF